MSLASFLPAPRQTLLSQLSTEPELTPTSTTIVSKGKKPIPPYRQRKGWIPRTQDDFGDGGAFPEIHVAQYPLGLGKKETTNPGTLALTVDGEGRVNYDAIVRQGSKRLVQSRNEDLKEKRFSEEDLARPDPEAEKETAEKTRAALERLVSGKTSAAESDKHISTGNQGPTFIRYTPANKSGAFNSGASSRIIRMTEMPMDPMEPPKFKHKKVPRGPPSPPAPVMHSPPRKLTMKDQQDWKVPPCVSNWKNNKGYTIPLDKRLAADGRGLQETVINDNFAKLSESLYIAEKNAREEVAKRAEIEKRLKLKEKEKKEELLRKLAQEARMERTNVQMETAEDEQEEKGRQDRDAIREERRRERERDLRIQRNRSAATRNAERDISERIALGQAVPTQSQEALFDQRLFNQTQGMSSGFGDDESYNVYTKPLFQGSSANILYKPKKGEEDIYGNEEDMQKLLDTSKFRPDKDFSGVDRSQANEPRNKPVEFEKDESDPFGLDEFLKEAKTGRATDKIGSQGHMSVSSSSSKESYEGGTKRGRLDFVNEKKERSPKRRK